MEASCSDAYRAYFANLERSLEELIVLTNSAKAKGYDPSVTVSEEVRVSRDIADRVEYMVGPRGVATRIRELSHLPRIPLAFKIAEEIIYGAFGVLDGQAAAEQAVKTGAAVLNEGVTAAPVQGIVKVEIKQRKERSRSDNPRYLSVSFAGPMRAAGGTELAIVTVLADYIRRLLGIEQYQATEAEIARVIEELRLYEREVGRFQFHISDEAIVTIMSHLPVEVTGIKTDPVEVSSTRDIPSIETNCIRGGALRVINDGIGGRAGKVWSAINEMKISGWDWLKELVITSKTTQTAETTYLHDIIAGRPVFSFPADSEVGSRLRLRYGRARNTGLASVGIHPATMVIVDEFIAIGTQLRLEMPGKAGVANAVDTIEPPIVKLKDGSVVRVESVEEARRVKDEVERVLFVGDILVSYAEFLENGKPLVPSSYVEEWWVWDLRNALEAIRSSGDEKRLDKLGIPSSRLKNLETQPLIFKPTPDEALRISRQLNIPLHPQFTYFWKNITLKEFEQLQAELSNANILFEGEDIREASILLPSPLKPILEKLLVPHKIAEGKIIINEHATTLYACAALRQTPHPSPSSKEILDIVKAIAGFPVKDRFASCVGARMARPEKADIRKTKPPVHALFPIGESGGAQRNIINASETVVQVEISHRICEKCGRTTDENLCSTCAVRTKLQHVCPRCSLPTPNGKCRRCLVEGCGFTMQTINVGARLKAASEWLGVKTPELFKGVKGLISENKTPEPLEKGILRARHNLWVFKDGTVRFDSTNACLTHFKPREIGVSLEALRELGYTVDKDGTPLVDAEQTCEIKVQDVILPINCGEYLLRIADFIDDLLVRFYKMPPYYKASSLDGLIGHIIIGLSPHTSAGVLGRILGFSKTRVTYSHPLWVSAKRRDCDGDEDAVMLALDVLLNFSRHYLPAQIGGIMDAPLLLTPLLNPMEVDDQVWTLDCVEEYPLEFYRLASEKRDSKAARNLVDCLGMHLGTPKQFEGWKYIHDAADINRGVTRNQYTTLKTMRDKLMRQMSLVGRIDGVNAQHVAQKLLDTHFIRDIMGNLKVFTTQSFRCKRCSHRYRRVPLKGKCWKCGGDISLTVFQGSVEKYLQIANWIIEAYNINDYYKQCIALLTQSINSLFQSPDSTIKEKPRMGDLTQYM